jgi:hypothetical protein
MSLKRKYSFDTSSSTSSLCAGDGSMTTPKYIKTEQLLERTSSNNIFYTNNSPSNERK